MSPSRGASCVAAALIVAMTATPPVVIAQTASVVPPLPPNGIVAVTVPSANASITRVASGSETLHLVVGHSLFLNTKLRLHKVYIADPAILNSITLNPNQIIVTAMAPGVSSLIVLDEAGQAQSYVISSDLDVTGLRTAIDAAVHDEVINVEGNGGRVILSGQVANPSLSDTVVKLANLYSKDVANSIIVAPGHPKQVKLKVRILEVDRTKLAQFGINLLSPGGNSSFLASTTTSQYSSAAALTTSGTTLGTAAGAPATLSTSSALNFLLYSSKLNLGVAIQDLETKNIAQILAEPEITTVSGRKASFLSGGEFPFPVIQPGGGSGSTSSVTIQFKPYGVKLDFTPTVNDDGTIRLDVAPEVSALDYTNAVSISGYTIPALSSRKADTEIELRSDQSFAISGLLDQRTTDLLSKTPGIASIPILGALFKSKNISHSTTELVVIVTPTLVDPLNEDVKITQPNMPISTLNTNSFDKSLGKRLSPNPTAPPINDAIPGADVLPPATPPAAQAAPPSAPQNVTPAPRTAPAAVSPSSTAVPVRPANGAENVLPPPAPYTAPPAAAASPAPLPASAARSVTPAQASSSLPTAVSASQASAPTGVGTAQPAHGASAAVVAAPAAKFTPAAATARNLAPGQSMEITAPAASSKQSVPTASSTPAPAHVVPASTTSASARVVPVSATTSSAHLVPASATTAPASSQSSASSPKPSQAPAPTVAVATAVPPPAIHPVPAPAVATATPPPSAASAPAMVQIMTLSHKEDVDAMVAALRRHGYDVAVTKDPHDSRIHLEVGPFKDRTEAEAMRQKLLTDGYDATVR
jgi:pilus assembly protein CpaC